MKRISLFSVFLLLSTGLTAQVTDSLLSEPVRGQQADSGQIVTRGANQSFDIGIAPEDSQISINILNKILASEFVLLAQTLNYHWNLVGPEFHDYHLLFNDQYKLIFEQIDAIAERVRAVGGIALGSLSQFIQNATIKGSEAVPAPREMVQQLLNQQQAIIRALRDGINQTADNERDMGTSNFLTELIEKHEKMAWMLRALLQ